MMMISKVRKSYLPGYEAYLENKYGVGRVGLSKRGNSGPIHRSSVNVGLPASYGMRFLHVSGTNNSAWKKSRKLKQGSEYRYKDNILKSNKMSTFIPEKDVSMSTLPFMPFHKREVNRDSRSYRHHRKHLQKRNFLKHGFENFMNSLSRELKSFRESKKTMGKRSSLPLYDYLYDMAYNSQGKNHDWAGKELDQEMDGKEQDDKEQRETKGEEDKETTPSSKLNFREYYAPILDDQIASLDSWLNQASENENYDYYGEDSAYSNPHDQTFIANDHEDRNSKNNQKDEINNLDDYVLVKELENFNPNNIGWTGMFGMDVPFMLNSGFI